MKKIKIVFLLLFTFFAISAFTSLKGISLISATNSPVFTQTPHITITPFPTSTNIPIPSIGIDTAATKENLEIEKLKAEIRSAKVDPLLQFGTLFSAFVAVVISFLSAQKSSKSQNESLKAQLVEQQKSLISNLLNQLGSEQLAVKISSIHALSEYESVIPFLVGLLQIEQEKKVINAVITALKIRPQIAFPFLITALREFYNQQDRWAIELIYLGKSREEIVERFGLDSRVFNELRNSNVSRRINLSLEKRLSLLVETNSQDKQEIMKNEISKIFTEWNQSQIARENILDAIEKIICHASQQGMVCSLENANLKGIILDNLNISKWSFSGCDLTESSFNRAICKKTDFSGSIAIKSDFRFSSLHDANFNKSIFDFAKFNGAKLVRTKMNNSSGKETRFFGSKITKLEADNSNFDHSKFEHLYIHESSFVGTEFKGANLSNCNGDNNLFIKSNLLGTDFNNSKLLTTNFHDARFAGDNFTKSDFSNSDFTKAKFKAIEKFDGIVLHDTSFNEAIFDERTELFVEEVNKDK